MNGVRNVLVLSDYAFLKGGAEKVALTSATALADAGLNVRLFSAVGPVAKGLDRLTVECLDQYDIASDPNRLRAMWKGTWNISAKARLAKTLSSLSPNDTVVHAHQWNKALTTSVFDAVARKGFRYVLTLHDYFIACPNGGFLNYPKTEICTKEPLSVGCIFSNCDVRSWTHKAWRVQRHVVQNKLYNLPARTKHCIYVSSFSHSVLRKYLPAETNWYHVSNPSDFDRAGRVDIASNQTFLFVGRLSAEKGPLVFAKAARQAGVRAVFVGDGEARDSILQADPDAIITGWLDREGVLEQYRQARALVFPSLWYECQPLAVLEALSLGVPVIVSDKCAGADAVVDGVNGYRFSRGSVPELVEKLRLLQDDDHAGCLSEQTYHRAHTTSIGMKEHVGKLMDVYDRVLNDKNGCT